MAAFQDETVQWLWPVLATTAEDARTFVVGPSLNISWKSLFNEAILSIDQAVNSSYSVAVAAFEATSNSFVVWNADVSATNATLSLPFTLRLLAFNESHSIAAPNNYIKLQASRPKMAIPVIVGVTVGAVIFITVIAAIFFIYTVTLRRQRWRKHRDRDFSTKTKEGKLFELAADASTQIDEVSYGRTVMTQLLKDGWCPHQMWHLQRIYGLRVLVYLAQRSNVEPLVTHQACYEEPACVAYNVKFSDYKTRHVTEDCNCGTVSVPYDELIKIIQSGDTPVVSIKSKDPGDLEAGNGLYLQIQNARMKGRIQKYVAISHVWAHGLGNWTGNGLPECQLRVMKDRLGSLSHGELFWMDTLCIPTQEENRDLRKQTIHNMASVYAMASAVLVLDLNLMKLTQSTKRHDLLSQLVCSAWMGRSWTYQEALLARRLAFQFEDAMLVLDPNWEIWINMQGKHSDSMSLGTTLLRDEDPFFNITNDFFSVLVQQLIQFKPRNAYFSPTRLEASRLILAWNALAGRTTTKSEDLYLILANVLDMETESLVGIDSAQEKLERIIFSFDTLPLSLFFLTPHDQQQNLSRVNAWVPSQITRELLDGRSTMKFVRQANVLELNVAEGGAWAVLVKVPALFSTDCLLSRPEKNSFWRVRRVFSGMVEAMEDHEWICLIISTQHNYGEQFRRGACFLVHGQVQLTTDMTPKATLETQTLSYGFPVRLYWCSKEMRENGEARHLPVFENFTLLKKGPLMVEYEPLVDFTPLTMKVNNNRRLLKVYYSLYWLFLGICGAVAIFVSSFNKISSTGGKAGLVVGYIAAAFLILPVTALVLYRKWLIPIGERYYAQRFEDPHWRGFRWSSLMPKVTFAQGWSQMLLYMATGKDRYLPQSDVSKSTKRE